MVRLAPQFFQKNLQFNTFSASGFLSALFPLKLQNGISCSWINNRHFSSTVDATEFAFDDVPTDKKATEKDTALRVAISELANEFGKNSLNRFFGTRRAAVISTGSLKLDLALGIGGLPKGRFVEIYGQEASGKTTLALHIIKEAQKQGGYCAYLDVENALNPLVARSIGVNTDNLLISQPDSAENLLSMVDTLTKSGSIAVIVVDSVRSVIRKCLECPQLSWQEKYGYFPVAALVPQHELDTTEVGSTMDILSKIMQQALRKISYSLCHSNTLIIFVNQTRFRPKSAQGFCQAEEVTCGGNFLPFYAAVRLKLIRKNLIMNEDKATGLGLCVQVVKNKLAPVMSDAMLRIQFGKGLCCESEVLELACEHGIVSNRGGCYFIGGETLNSNAEAESYLAANKDVLDEIVKSLRYQLFERKS